MLSVTLKVTFLGVVRKSKVTLDMYLKLHSS